MIPQRFRTPTELVPWVHQISITSPRPTTILIATLGISRKNTMTQHDWLLLILAVVAIALLVLLIVRWKMNAFIALILASLIVGVGAVAMRIHEVSLVKNAAGLPVWTE